MRSDGRILKTEQGLLVRSLQPSDSGLYQCTATEKNFKHTLIKLQLVVLSSRAVNSALVEGGAGLMASSFHSGSTQWTPSAGQYKDLLTILSQPEMSLINQYCQDYWQFGDPLLGPLKAKDLKELKEQKKPRNRRHHRDGEEEREQQGVETWGARLCVWSTPLKPTPKHNPPPPHENWERLNESSSVKKKKSTNRKKKLRNWQKKRLTSKPHYTQYIHSNSKIYDTQYLL